MKVASTDPLSAKAPPESGASFPSVSVLFGALLVYFAFQIAARTLISSSVDLDESEQVVFTQWLSPGYGPVPPLYTWLQLAAFKVLGTSVFAMALLKNALLFSLYCLAYANARWITGSHKCGVVACLSLFFIPQVAWESQRDLTHTILGSMGAAATLSFLMRAHEQPSWKHYSLLGLAVGIGLLAKFNYALWLLGLVVGTVSVTDTRRTILSPKILIVPVIAAALVLPYTLWIIDHRHAAFASTAKLKLDTTAELLHPLLEGFKNVVVAVPAILGPIAAIYFLIFRKAPVIQPPSARCVLWRRVLTRTLLTIAGVVLILIIGFKVTGFRERWFQPILISAPVLAVAFVAERMSDTQVRRIASLAIAVMALVGLAIPSRIYFGEQLRRDEPLMRPYDLLATQLEPELPGVAYLLGDSLLTAGNLKMQIPKLRVLTPSTAPLFPNTNLPFLAVWDARRGDTMPPKLQEFLSGQGIDQENGTPWFLTATYKYHHKKQMRLGVLRFPDDGARPGSRN
jgi:4-amino-4-deoxy-L-arabinose transferase-like glycosyltransferase